MLYRSEAVIKAHTLGRETEYDKGRRHCMEEEKYQKVNNGMTKGPLYWFSSFDWGL